jgi:hypothetical protein
MPRIEKHSDFNATLSKLPLDQQHQLAKQFIAGVIHLSSSPRLAPLADLLKNPGCSLDDIRNAHQIARSVYVETSVGSDIAPIEYNCQATHFIAQAVLACSTPDPAGATASTIAQKVANYCRMAQTCSAMGHGGEAPDFDGAESAYNQIMQAQIDLANRFLEGKGA